MIRFIIKNRREIILVMLTSMKAVALSAPSSGSFDSNAPQQKIMIAKVTPLRLSWPLHVLCLLCYLQGVVVRRFGVAVLAGLACA